jgi:hypothetical protein
MRTWDEDDADDESWRGGPSGDDPADEGPDEADRAVEGGPVRCVHCNKYIHEDAEMCPHCHRWQTDEFNPPRKARWYFWTVIYCVVIIVVFWIILRYAYLG